VTTRKHGEPSGHVWIWRGGSQFEVEEDEKAQIGTKIELWLREGETEKFADPKKVIGVINKSVDS
jgi:HSP90 family molecular chaperone